MNELFSPDFVRESDGYCFRAKFKVTYPKILPILCVYLMNNTLEQSLNNISQLRIRSLPLETFHAATNLASIAIYDNQTHTN